MPKRSCVKATAIHLASDMIRNKHKLLHSIASVQTSLIYNTGKTDWFFCHIFTFIIASFWNYHFCQQVPPGKKQLYDSCTASLASNSGQRHQVITTRCQFHQSSTHSFCACRFRKGKKTQLSHWYLFTLSGSASVKAVRRTLMKLTADHRWIRKGRQPRTPLFNLKQKYFSSTFLKSFFQVK